MKNLNLHVTVPADRRVVLQLPDEVESGEVELTVIVRRRSPARSKSTNDTLGWFPTLNVSSWDPNTSLRREDLYDDEGR